MLFFICVNCIFGRIFENLYYDACSMLEINIEWQYDNIIYFTIKISLDLSVW